MAKKTEAEAADPPLSRAAALLAVAAEPEPKEKKEKKEKASSKKRKAEEGEQAPAAAGDVKPTKEKKAKPAAKKLKAEEPPAVAPAAESLALESFALSAPVVAKLRESGIAALFPIQAATFNVVMDGHDLVGRARTGQVRSACSHVACSLHRLAVLPASRHAPGRRARRLPSCCPSWRCCAGRATRRRRPKPPAGARW